MADNGVLAIIGHHPHVLQPVEWLEGTGGNKMLCVYSLGNLASGMIRPSKMLGGFISFEQGSSGGGRSTINLSLDSGPQILALISPDVSDYLAALMAPLATGEKMTKAEYLALVGTVYGRGIADEIAGAAVRVAIDFPGPVQRAVGGTFSGRRAEFAIPLLDLLVLETPLSYEVAWR
jgi:hypothetical protein